MKKRVWSLVLCLVLVCTGFAGCGEEKDDGTEEIISERMVKSELQKFADSVSDLISMPDKYMMPLSNVGYDYTMEYSFAGLDENGEENPWTEALKGSLDFKGKDGAHVAASWYMGDEEIFSVDFIEEGDFIYTKFPAYSKNYLKDSVKFFQEAYGVQEEAKDMLSIWKTFSTEFIKAFEYQGKEEKQSIGIGDYKITGDKYTVTAEGRDVEAAFGTLVEEMMGFSRFRTSESDLIRSGWEKLNANYYTGKNGAYAWEFQGSGQGVTESAVFISAEKGFYLYVVDGNGRDQALAFSKKEAARKGKITIVTDEKIEFAYDNYTKNSVDITATIGEIEVLFKLQSKGSKGTVEISFGAGDIDFTGKLESTEESFDFNISLGQSGIEVIKAKISSTMRDFVSYKTPKGMDWEEWVASLDKKKMKKDFDQLIALFPELEEVLGSPAVEELLREE